MLGTLKQVAQVEIPYFLYLIITETTTAGSPRLATVWFVASQSLHSFIHNDYGKNQLVLVTAVWKRTMRLDLPGSQAKICHYWPHSVVSLPV